MGERFPGIRNMLLCALIIAASPPVPGLCSQPTASPKEALMLRRITEYWKDGDYDTVKRQIIDFLKKNPDTALHDHLQAMLGDLYFQKRQYQQALATYDLIGNPEIIDKTFFNRLQAQFEARDFLAVVEEAKRYLKEQRGSPLETKVRYLLAESYFRHALKSRDVEEKVLYLKLAKPQYKILTQSKYSSRALFPLAEIHRLLRENDRAASLYLSLAEKYPKHRERFLFQSAILQIQSDRREAEATFARVYEMGGKRSKLAAFNRLILLYQLQRYSEFLAFYKQVIGLMPDQKVPLLKFYEGRCLYAMGDYLQAVMPLEEFIAEKADRCKERKTAYLLLVNCSRYNKDIALLERTLYAFKSAFPKDREIPKVLMIHAQMCRENGDYTQALTDLKTLVEGYPNYEDAEGALYDYALLLSQTDKWVAAREKFLSFLDQYPMSERKTAAWRHLLNCCIEEIKSPSQVNPDGAKHSFIQILKRVMDEDQVLTLKEQKQYALTMLKCRCELNEYAEVIPQLSQYIADTVEDDLLAEAHLLMAICMQKTNSDLSLFIQHAQTALSYNSNLPERDLLYLELYNAYLSKSLSTPDEGNRNYFLRQAAHHLFESEAWKRRSIKLDNYLWLAGHYYNRARLGDSEAFERAEVLFTDLLGLCQEEATLNLSADSLYLEGEVLKYAHLLALSGKHAQRIALLEKLVRKQEASAGLPWKLKRRCLLELGRAYEANHQVQDALGTYKTLVERGGNSSSMVTSSAQLHLAKLEYQLLKPAQRTSQSAEMIAILHTLKDLQIQKKLLAEPLHLEAALQYVEIRLSLSDPAERAKNAQFFYKRMHEDFHSKEDPIAEEYNHLRASHPDKDAIFNVYMRYVDAELLKSQSKLAMEEQKTEQALEYEETALKILDSLLAQPEHLQPYLLDRVKRSRIEITQKL